jgi:hypothetical protein
MFRYDKADNVQYFKDHINRARDVAGGRPIWITELGPQGTDAEIKVCHSQTRHNTIR